MLYRNAPFLLASACLCLLYVMYSGDDKVAGPSPSSPKHASLLFASDQQRQRRPPHPDSLYSGPNRTRLKTVLYWNEFYGRYDTYDFGYGRQAFAEKEGCRYKYVDRICETCFKNIKDS